MSRKPIPKTVKKYIRETCQRFAWSMDVSHFQLDIKYMDEDKAHDDDRDTMATMWVDTRYLKAGLSIFPCFIKKYPDKKYLDSIIAHEVAHIATAHLYRCATSRYLEEEEMKDAWEALTERLSRVALALNNKIWKK